MLSRALLHKHLKACAQSAVQIFGGLARFKALAYLIAATVAAGAVSPANAATVTMWLTEFAGADAYMKVDLKDVSVRPPNTTSYKQAVELKFTFYEPSGRVGDGDITGLFFNLKAPASNYTVSSSNLPKYIWSSDISQYTLTYQSSMGSKCDGSTKAIQFDNDCAGYAKNDLSGYDPPGSAPIKQSFLGADPIFDIAIHLKKDAGSTTTLYIRSDYKIGTTTHYLTTADFLNIGARVTDIRNCDVDWSKLLSPKPPDPNSPVPEPSTWGFMASGVILLALFKRRLPF